MAAPARTAAMGAPARNLAWWARQHFGALRTLSFLLWLSPAAWLGVEYLTDTLGVNPLNRLLHVSGRWAVVMLLVTLAVTPLRRLSVAVSQAAHARYGKRVSDWNWLIRLRRQFGLFAFFYAGLHLAFYLVLDVGLDGATLRDDFFERPFVAVGALAFLLLVPLAATSNQASIRALGRGWRRLHCLSYPIAVLALLHFWMQMKVGQAAPWADTVLLVLLLGTRVRAWLGGERSGGVEVKER